MNTKNLATINMNEKIDDIIAFTVGDISVTLLALYHFDMMAVSLALFSYAEIAVKVGLAIVVGFAGGAFGLFGKDVYVKYFRDRFMGDKKPE